MFRTLIDAAMEVATERFEHLPDSEVGAQIVELRKVIGRLEAACSKRVRWFDSRDAYRADGAASMVAWLRDRCGLAGGPAAQRVEVARELEALPGAAALLENGELSFDHAAVLARTAVEIGVRATEIAGPGLVHAAKTMQPEELRNLGRQLRHAVDPAGELATELRNHARRRLKVSPTFDGMVVVDGLLDAEGGAVLRSALEPLCKPLADEHRNADQRRADALVELAQRGLQTGTLPTSGGVRPHLLLTAAHRGATGESADPAAAIAGVGAVSTTTFERISCDCAVTEVTSSGDGEPLSVGRTRRTTPASMRRALIHRDQGCAWPGCDRPPQWTESHHIAHWMRHRGRTEVANLALLCRVHHRMAHEGRWKLSLEGGKLRVEPP